MNDQLEQLPGSQYESQFGCQNPKKTQDPHFGSAGQGNLGNLAASFSLLGIDTNVETQNIKPRNSLSPSTTATPFNLPLDNLGSAAVSGLLPLKLLIKKTRQPKFHILSPKISQSDHLKLRYTSGNSIDNNLLSDQKQTELPQFDSSHVAGLTPISTDSSNQTKYISNQLFSPPPIPTHFNNPGQIASPITSGNTYPSGSLTNPSSPFSPLHPNALQFQYQTGLQKIQPRDFARVRTASACLMIPDDVKLELFVDSTYSNTTQSKALFIPDEEFTIASHRFIDNRETSTFFTYENAVPPLQTSQINCIDQGTSSPKFMSSSLYNIPTNDSLRKLTRLPIALNIRPFAPVEEEGDVPVPQVDWSERQLTAENDGPLRCNKCGGYINSTTQFTVTNNFICNLCQHSNPLPDWYQCGLDSKYKRLDHDSKPELCKGVVDHIVDEKFWQSLVSGEKPQMPIPLHFVFLIDVSALAFEKGMVVSTCEAILLSLYKFEDTSDVQTNLDQREGQLINEDSQVQDDVGTQLGSTTTYSKLASSTGIAGFDLNKKMNNGLLLVNEWGNSLDTRFGAFNLKDSIEIPNLDDPRLANFDDPNLPDPNQQMPPASDFNFENDDEIIHRKREEALLDNADNFTCMLPEGSKIAIITYDKNVQFYNMNRRLTQPIVNIVSDSPFLPFETGLFVDPRECKDLIVQTLELIQLYPKLSRSSELSFGFALKCAFHAIKELTNGQGGKICCNLSSTPNFGEGILSVKKYQDAGLSSILEKEKLVLQANNSFYLNLANEFCDHNVSLDLFISSNLELDLVNSSYITKKTGGILKYYHDRELNERQYVSDYIKCIRDTIGYQGHLKVRCSKGLLIEQYYGNFFNEKDPKIPNLHKDSTFGVLLKYEGKLNIKLDCHFQAAILYTTVGGTRKLRIINLVTSITDKVADIFASSNQDVIMDLVIRDCIRHIPGQSLQSIRDSIDEKVKIIFKQYRELVVSKNEARSKFIIPESLKTLAEFLLSFKKSKSLKRLYSVTKNNSRIFNMFNLSSLPLPKLQYYLYPYIAGLHKLNDQDCTYDEVYNKFNLPKGVNANLSFIEVGGCYLIFNGVAIIIWMHKDVSKLLLKDLFDVDSLQELNPLTFDEFPDHVDTEIARQTKNLVNYFKDTVLKQDYLSVKILRFGIDDQREFLECFVDDTMDKVASYGEYLSDIHKSIKNSLST